MGAARADVVGLSGLGRTLPDGHRHEVRWSESVLRAQLKLMDDEARRARTAPAVEAFVQKVIPTEDRQAAIDELSTQIPGASAQDIAGTPFLLIGTPHEMAAQIRKQAQEFGISRYVVREAAVSEMEPVLALLAT